MRAGSGLDKRVAVQGEASEVSCAVRGSRGESGRVWDKSPVSSAPTEKERSLVPGRRYRGGAEPTSRYLQQEYLA